MRKKSRMSWFMLFVFMMTIIGGVGLGVPQASAANLTDIQGHWAQTTIQKLADAGVVAGNPDGTFKPNNSISRAEFASMVVKAFKLEAKPGKIFSDTTNHWAKDSIATANANGVVSGYGDKFGPNDPITREQMAIMIVKAAKLAPAAAELTFADAAKISTWAKNDVVTAFANKLIAGSNGLFNPQSNATRAEAATVVSAGLKPVEPIVTPAGDLSKLDKAGTYGPATGSQNVTGNVTISASGVILQNAIISGDLLIAEGVGSGDVTLKNVTVKGTATINGGGENSITIENCKFAKVTVNKADGKIRLVLSGATSITELVADSAVNVEGQATINKATINKAGVVIEAKPAVTYVARNLTATVAATTVKGATGGGGGGGGGSSTPTVSTVTASTASGAVASGTAISLSCATDGATIYYTVDGSVPTIASTVYTTPISITAAKTIKAIAVKTGSNNSAVATFAYTISGSDTITANADVAVGSGAMSSFKTITVKAIAGLTGAAKYKVADGTTTSAVKDLGTAASYMTSATSVTVTILGSDGTTALGTGTLSVAAAATNASFTVTVAAPAAKSAVCSVAVGAGAMASFKTITVASATGLTGAAKYKVADGTTTSAVKALGTAASYMTSATSVTVTILASDGTTSLGTGTLSVAAASNNTTIAIQ